jgi:hypothetical protein
LFQILVQTIKTFFPKFPILLDPLLRFFHRLGLQFQRMHAPATAAADQSGIFQNAQMLRDRRQRHGIRPRQIGDATVAVREMFQDAPSRRIGQRGKRAVQQSR